MTFTEKQIERYSRQMILEDIGGQGQKKLLASKILVIGVGGLGAPAILYLAAAGIGTLGLVDDDLVEMSNLQRQIVHFSSDIGSLKIDSAAKKIRDMNPDVRVVMHQQRFDADSAESLMGGYDFIVDASDNFATKFLINDACVLSGKPFSHGGVIRFVGQTMTVVPHQSACYRCVFHMPPEEGLAQSCAEAGILGPVPGMIGCIQATEAIKYVASFGSLLTNIVLTYDAANMDFRKVKIKRNLRCPSCSDNAMLTDLNQSDAHACINLDSK